MKSIRKSQSFGITAKIEGGDFNSIQQKNWKNVELLVKGLKGLIASYKIETPALGQVYGGKRLCRYPISKKKEIILKRP